MTAEIHLVVRNGEAPGTPTDVESLGGIDFVTADNALHSQENRNAYPITIPTSGYSRSYEKWMQFKCVVPPDNQCTNFKVWGPNTAPETGVVIMAKSSPTYSTPIIRSDDDGFAVQHENYYDSDHALAVSGTLTASGQMTGFFVMYNRVDNTALPGNMTQVTFTYSYDEQ